MGWTLSSFTLEEPLGDTFQLDFGGESVTSRGSNRLLAVINTQGRPSGISFRLPVLSSCTLTFHERKVMTLFADGGDFPYECGQNISAFLCSDHFYWPYWRTTGRSLVGTSASVWPSVASPVHLSVLSIQSQAATIPPFAQSSLSETDFVSFGANIVHPFISLSTYGSLRSIQKFLLGDGSQKPSFHQTPHLSLMAPVDRVYTGSILFFCFRSWCACCKG